MIILGKPFQSWNYLCKTQNDYSGKTKTQHRSKTTDTSEPICKRKNRTKNSVTIKTLLLFVYLRKKTAHWLVLQGQAIWILNDLCKGLKESSQISSVDNTMICCHIHLATHNKSQSLFLFTKPMRQILDNLNRNQQSQIQAYQHFVFHTEEPILISNYSRFRSSNGHYSTLEIRVINKDK